MDAQFSTESRASVLLVEDEPMICELAKEALLEHGFDVKAVANATEALHYLNSGSPIDVLFTDVNLHDGMGGGFLARRARELHPGLPVMYTSGRRSTTECLDPVEGSMFIPKPYDPFRIGQLLEYLVAMKSIPVAHKVAGMV